MVVLHHRSGVLRVSRFIRGNILGERALRHTAASLSGWEVKRLTWRPSFGAVVGDELAVSSQAGVAAIKDRRLGQVVCVFEPIPVLQFCVSSRFCSLHRICSVLAGWAPL